MRRVGCTHEDDVLMYVGTGRWPDRAPAELVAHAVTCPVCGDLAMVSRAMGGQRDEELTSARVPSAGTVWWHAQLRARQDAARSVGKPITLAQGALLAACGGVAGAVFGATTGWFQRALHATADAARSVTSSVHLPPLPNATDATTFAATYGTSLAVAGISIAIAVGVVIWAFKEG
jgi:hypothetical protein